MTISPFTLRSVTTQTNAPFVLGHAFKKGDAPAGSQLVASIPDFQVTPKNVWSDGSLKYAVLAGRAALTGGVDLPVTMTIGTPAAGTALTLADLKTTGVTASIAAGAFGTISWATTDWDAAFESWISGPKMSSWIYRKAVGTDAHLVGWLEVRLWSGGEVEVLPWIENGYMLVAGPTNKSATYVFTLGGTQRESVLVDLKHHQRTPLITGTKLSHWLVTDPAVVPLSSAAYLQASELVPTYSAVLAAGAARVTAQVTTFTPLQQGGFDYDGDAMPSSGYQRPIGLLPEHDVLHLVANVADRLTTYGAVVRNGYSAGRYCIHFRDENTNRPTTFTAYPTKGLTGGEEHGVKDVGGCNGGYTPVPTGGSGPAGWDTSHSPSVAFMAYLVTGLFYFKEEVQFAAVVNHYCTTDWLRAGGTSGSNMATYTGASGICTTLVQTRQGAWKLRTLAQALCVTPDAGDPMRASLIASVEDNCRYFNNMFVVQANNPQGLIYSPEVYTDVATDRRMVPIWQHDFYTAAWGMMLAFDLPVSSTAKANMTSFFAWKAKSIVHRLGTTAGYRFERAAVYEYAMSPSPLGDSFTGTGPWYASDAAAYAATMVGSQAITPTDGALYYAPIDGQPERSMWGNLHPAIAYAVRHGVAGASAAYARLVGASNYSTLTTGFNSSPVWAVAPASNPGAAIVTTPGPSFIWDTVSLIPGAFVWGTHRGHGITVAEIPTGFATEALLAKHVLPGANPASEYRWSPDTVPAGLNFNIGENSSFDASAVADGVYNGNKTVYTDGVGDPGTYQFTFADVTPTITGITISPTTATGATTFNSVVSGTGAFSSAKTFSKVSGGGSINASTGVFVPPAQTGGVQTVVVRATSTQDPTKYAEAIITIAAGSTTVSGVTISPTTATLAGGGIQDFDAVVSGTFNPSQSVVWSCNLGSIDVNGVFTAPASTGTTQNATITATSVQDPSKSKTASVAILSGSSVTSVTVAPADATIAAGTSRQYTATVTGPFSPSQQVSWSASIGTISNAGLYTAPPGTNNTQAVAITATSVQDSSKSGAAFASIPPGAGSAATVTSVSITPIATSMVAGGAKQFTATVNGSNNPSSAVSWTASAGVIDQTGLFIAPAALPLPQNVVITATSVADNTKSVIAIASIPASGVVIAVDNSVHKYSGNVTNKFGVIIEGASIEVLDVTTGQPAILFKNREQEPKYNPVLSDDEGYFEFYVLSGIYSATVSGYGIETYTIDDIVFSDSSGGSIPRLPAFTLASLPSANTNIQGLIYISDGAVNKRLAISDGFEWRWADGTIVS